uniref:Vomeronasal type-1 receptor n=1 Tax=Marmota marmota marmota TaxID=9994 RepID=A0A8C6ET95_MARMA
RGDLILPQPCVVISHEIFLALHLISQTKNECTFYSEVGIGILANTILFLFHVIKFLCDKRLKNTDCIIGLLALTHLLMLLTMGFIALMRGLSISATCLLSVLQALTLSPRSSPLAKFKPKAPQDSMRSLLFLWVFYMSFSAHFSISAVDNSTGTSQGLIFLSDSCTILPMSYFLRHLFTVLGALRDVFLIGLMALSSGYMVTLLHRQCHHIHGTSLSPKASPEQRATRTILVLLGFFVLMSCLDCVISSSRTMWNNDPVCHSIQMMVANGYATSSPLVFICTEKHSLNFLKFLCGKDSKCWIIA